MLPSSPLGEAIGYTLNQWDSLCLFLKDGDIPLDNNRTEHALRQQVLGRLNWLFVGSEQGGDTAAVLYTLVATCKRLRIDPLAYLRDVFETLPKINGQNAQEQLHDLLPDRWIEKHPEHRLAHREKEASQAQERRRQQVMEAKVANRKAIEAKHAGDLPVTSSFGASAKSLGAGSPQDLIDQADQALYASKQGSRHRTSVHRTG